MLCAAGAAGVLKKEKSALPRRKIPVRQRVCAWNDPLTATRSRTVRKNDALRPGHGNFSKKVYTVEKRIRRRVFPCPALSLSVPARRAFPLLCTRSAPVWIPRCSPKAPVPLTAPKKLKTTTALPSLFPVQSWNAAAWKTPDVWACSSSQPKPWA